MEIVYAGIDTGSRTIKIHYKLNGKIRKVQTASVFCKAPENLSTLKLLKRPSEELAKNMLLEVKGERYLFGDIAIDQAEAEDLITPIDGNLLKDVYKEEGDRTEEDIKNAKIVIAGVLALIETRNFLGNEAVLVRMTTGVPMGTSEALVKEMKNLYVRGTHSFTVENLATGQKVEKNVSVKECYMIPEPVGSLYDMVYEFNGEMKKKNPTTKAMIKSSVGIIDIGYGTDCVFRRDPKAGIIMSACDTNKVAMKYFNELLAMNLSRVLRAKNFSNFDIPSPLELDNATKDKILNIGSEKIKEFDSVIQETARRFFERNLRLYINEHFLQKGRVQMILVTGGGAKIFYPLIQREYTNPQYKIKVKTPEDPEMANSKGFLKNTIKELLNSKDTKEI